MTTAPDTPAVPLDARNYLARRHRKRSEWWADQLRYNGGDWGLAAVTQVLTDRLTRAGLVDMLPQLHDAWTTGVVGAGRVAFG